MITHNSKKLPSAPEAGVLETTFACTGESGTQALQNIVGYLCEWVNGSLPKLMNESEEAMYPIAFNLEGDIECSEYGFWSLAADNCENADRLLLDYIRALEAVGSSVVLGAWSDEYHQYGLIPIQIMVERRLSEVGPTGKLSSDLLAAFVLYIEKVCYLDSETSEDEYISKILFNTRYSGEVSTYFRLLSLRLLRGQYGLIARDFEYFDKHLGASEFSDNANLKRFLEYSLAEFRSEWLENETLTSHLPFLLRAIYGSQSSPIEDISLYLSKVLGTSIILKDQDWLKVGIEWVRGSADLKLGRVSRDLYTGFHRFDSDTRLWTNP